MRTYNEDRALILGFLKENQMKVYDLARIARDMSTCEKCRFYTQHYDKDGKYVDFGHCVRNKGNHATRPHTSACGFWDVTEEGMNEIHAGRDNTQQQRD